MPEQRVSMSDGLAERVVRRAIAALANSYATAPARATAAKEMLVHTLEGNAGAADEADGYAAAAALAALAHAVEGEWDEGWTGSRSRPSRSGISTIRRAPSEGTSTIPRAPSDGSRRRLGRPESAGQPPR
jgi:hypothetical protein